MATLKIYEFTAPGFDGGTDETDHLVKWIAATSEAAAKAYAFGEGWRNWGPVDIFTPQDDESLMLAGVDVILRGEK